MISRPLAPVALAAVFLLAACGEGGSNAGKATAPASPAATVTPTGATSTSAAATTTTGTALPPASTATPIITVAASAKPPPSGESGIEGMATIGPTCPVERADSPCPDRPYEARITFWRGGTLVAEARSGTDGRFRVALLPGTYLVVGESEGTMPHAVEQTVDVHEGLWTDLAIRYDSGIR
jgi:hypothetical protein